MWKVGSSKRPAIVSKHKWETIEGIKALAETYKITTYELSGLARKMNLEQPAINYAKQLISEYNVNFSLHGEFFTSLMCNEDKDYFESQHSLTNSLKYAKIFNCPVVIHPGGTKTNSTTQLNHAIDKFGRAISEVGIDPSLVYVETMGKTYQFGSLLDCIYIANALNTRICVDWSHLYARFMAEYGSFTKEMVLDILEVMRIMPFPNEQYYHISGMLWNKKQGEIKHIEFEKSDFPYQMVCEEIAKSGLSGRIIVECDGDFANGAHLIRKEMEKHG